MAVTYRTLVAASLLCAVGCTSRAPSPEVVAYSSVDKEFAEPVFQDFQRETGIQVVPRYRPDSIKSPGLAEQIIEQNGAPQGDVFWNGEILQTLRLDERGLLDEYPLPSDEELPEMYRAPRGTWHVLGARARVLLVNTEVVKDKQLPRSIRDMVDRRWRGQVGMARPFNGTSATHAACLFAAWGQAKAEQFFLELKDNHVQVMGNNKQVAVAVGAGQLAFGLTDSDDAIAEIDRLMPVAIVYPDQAADQVGTLFIPNTISVLKGAHHPKAARRLVSYILSPAVETQLAQSSSAQIPLRPDVDATSRLKIPERVHRMEVDFGQAAQNWDASEKFLHREFDGL
jgi:iron(III) transport system substrate-binding protein